GTVHRPGSGVGFPPTAQPLVVEGRSWGWPGGWVAQGPLQVRPCKLGRAIHGAYAPAQPTRPATDNFRARPPRKRKRRSKAEAGRSARHPRMAWIYWPSSETVGGGAVWGCRTVGAMDGAIEPPWMG